MDTLSSLIGSLGYYWLILPGIVCLLFFKHIVRIFGVVIIPEDKSGLVIKKFKLVGGNKQLPEGRIIATKGEAGFQANLLPAGVYFFYWPWQYEIEMLEFTMVEAGKIGLVKAKDGVPLPANQILARTKCEHNNFQDACAFLEGGGEKGKQTKVLTPGSYRINTALFDVTFEDATQIAENKVGIITTFDGCPLDTSKHIAGKFIEGHNNFQDVDAFLENEGSKGLQEQIVLAGTYYFNPWFVDVEEVELTQIPIGHVGVVISFVGEEGEDTSGTEFAHGNIVKKGQKGVWETPLEPGKYPINTHTTKVEIVPTTNIVLNWASARTESHNLDKNLSTIKLRDNSGFTFTLDVSQIIHVPMSEAPKVIARFGSMSNLVSQVLEPTIGNYFRNSAQGSDVLGFLNDRTKRQEDAKSHIEKVLTEYNVKAVDTLIGDITPPDELMKPLTDRKIAKEQTETYTTQMEAQKTRQKLEQESALADKQRDLVAAKQSIIIAEDNAAAAVKAAEGAKQAAILHAEGEAARIEQTGKAEAGKIKAIGEATAEAYQKATAALGANNFTLVESIKHVADSGQAITPQIFVQGNDGNNGGGLGQALIAMIMNERMNKEEESGIPDSTAQSAIITQKTTEEETA